MNINAKHPDLTLYDGHFFAFPGTFLAKSREYMSGPEREAAEIIRATIEGADYRGRNPLDVVHHIQRRALAKIQELGSVEAFVQEYSPSRRDESEAA